MGTELTECVGFGPACALMAVAQLVLLPVVAWHSCEPTCCISAHSRVPLTDDSFAPRPRVVSIEPLREAEIALPPVPGSPNACSAPSDAEEAQRSRALFGTQDGTNSSTEARASGASYS